MILDILKAASTKSEWAAWVTNDKDHAAEEIREFLNVCFSNIPPNKRGKLICRIQQADQSGIEAAIHELVTYELLRRLGHTPVFDPNINGATPDISIEIHGTKFIADAFVTHNPLRTVVEATSDTLFTIDAGERAQKIAESIKDKSSKYVKTNLPLILFVFLGDHSVRVMNVEQALFGITVNEIGRTERSVFGIKETDRINSVFLSEEVSKPKYPNLSAVIACDWFDTLNRARPGKRLHCVVFHHWNPSIRLPLDTFADFLQVVWKQEQSSIWKHEIIGRSNAARFTVDGGIKFGIYTADNPW